jgi:threonyl-tRNA synthetase
MDKNIMNKISPEILRHSAAHLLAHAIYHLYPNTLFGIGPATEEGFFYDIVKLDGTFKQEDLKKITEEMKKLIDLDIPLTHNYIKKEEGVKLFSHNKFKLDIIKNQISEDRVGIATQGDFVDLCKGGHVKRTSELKHFVLTQISGSYWRANKEGDRMQRISGIIFETQEELENHIKLQNELEKYDHRALGKEMELFNFHDEGPGFPFFYPKGMAVINALINYMRELTSFNEYQEIKTPTLLNQNLWIKSGHYEHYKDNMYCVCFDETEYAIKPMNCPGAFIVYSSRPRSYRELPLRLSEFGHVHRHELSGTLHGLTRVRAFTQDDAHIFCLMNQITSEIKLILKLMTTVMEKAHLKISKIVLSTRPLKAAGSIEVWNKAIQSLKEALNSEKLDYVIAEGDGAFYGPKIGFEMQDNFNRIWSCGTVQLDFVQPENFDLKCINSSGEEERVVVIHQALFGSLERFFAICLEHHKGKLPFWMAPVQIKIIAMNQDQIEYCNEIYKTLLKAQIRVEFDHQNLDPLKAQLQKSIIANNFLSIIIGKKELESQTVSIRYNYTNIQENNILISNLLEKLNTLS